jgi:hypothetical protein
MKLVLNCLVFLTIFKVISCSKEDNTRVILSHMQDWGKEIFKTLTETNRGQYLVAALLSDDDLNTPHKMPGKLLKGCPNAGPDQDKQMIMCSTSGVFLNRKSEEILNKSRWNDTKYKDHPWHGEYILLREGFIEKLMKNFGTHKNCQVYLYSYYIPCADINGTPYSCSNEILIYNDRGDISCKITVIGYTEVFRRSNKTLTNETIAVNNINSANAQLFQNLKKAKLMAIKGVKGRNRDVPFQELMFSCLIQSHLSGCCVSSISYSRRSKEIIAYFVNNMVHTAINKIKSDLNVYTINKYLKYFDTWTENAISHDCDVCRFEFYHKLVIKFCTERAMELASGFGKPSVPTNLSHASWTFNGEPWNILYNTSPKEFRDTKMLLCERPLTVNSICTKYDPDENTSQQRDNDNPLHAMRTDRTLERIFKRVFSTVVF